MIPDMIQYKQGARAHNCTLHHAACTMYAYAVCLFRMFCYAIALCVRGKHIVCVYMAYAYYVIVMLLHCVYAACALCVHASVYVCIVCECIVCVCHCVCMSLCVHAVT